MENIELMKEVLRREAQAIEELANHPADTWSKLLEICGTCSGKIIISGMGKSGHVSRKISATLASLGTPSFYLHPGEAAHGDLGMVEKSDVVMLISKSGETEELLQLINSLKVIGCTIVGVFCEKDSSLETYCDLTIVLPVEEEACINNLAPTVSTTLTMAFGDALAIALSSKKKFGKNDFALFHPKGALGKQLLLTVYDLANRDSEEISVTEDTNIETILWRITKNRLGAVAVVDGSNKLKGLISDGDIRREIKKDRAFFEKKASQIMIVNPMVADEKMLASEAFVMMNECKKSVLPIIDGNNGLKGMVSFHDIVASGIGGNSK